MRGYSINKNEGNQDRVKSAVLSAVIWSAILLFVFIYKLEPKKTEPEPELVTTMLINFGDNRNGLGIEEPAAQEGSLAAQADEILPEPVENPVEETKTVITPSPKPESKKTEVKDKVIAGVGTKTVTPKKEEAKSNTKPASNAAANSKAKSSSAAIPNSKVGKGDGKGNAAIGNLLNGRGTKTGNQGTGSGPGNNGDPLGGDGNGDSKVGIDRSLVGYIPGTMGRGGAQPSHACTAGGSITISYTVDKAGNVSSARRSGGVSDPCVVSTSISWVKTYVKAEKANTSSSGTYKITF